MPFPVLSYLVARNGQRISSGHTAMVRVGTPVVWCVRRTRAIHRQRLFHSAGTLEGLGLSIDKDYSIVQVCIDPLIYPHILL